MAAGIGQVAFLCIFAFCRTLLQGHHLSIGNIRADPDSLCTTRRALNHYRSSEIESLIGALIWSTASRFYCGVRRGDQVERSGPSLPNSQRRCSTSVGVSRSERTVSNLWAQRARPCLNFVLCRFRRRAPPRASGSFEDEPMAVGFASYENLITQGHDDDAIP